MIKMIVAWDKNNLIGKKNGLPWKIKEELGFFRKQTMNQYLLMGETTFLTLPKILSGRKIIVMSKDKSDLGFKTIKDFNYVLENFKKGSEDIYIAGGKSIYEQFYGYADEIYISLLKGEYEGDVYLNLDLSNFKQTIYKEFTEFTVYKYIKNGAK